MSEERLKENKRKVERMVKRMDCQMDVLAEADIFKKGGKGAAERRRRARTARAEPNRVDEIITHGYYKEIHRAATREVSKKDKLTPKAILA